MRTRSVLSSICTTCSPYWAWKCGGGWSGRYIQITMQDYLLARLTEDASRPTLEEVLRRAGDRASGSVPLADAVRAVRADRDAR
ncbi:MAG: hypothetical protein ACRDLD_06040 [Thermoleophilaceae bacterium]